MTKSSITKNIISCPIRARAITHPDATAIYLTDNKLSYQQLDNLVNQRAKALENQGMTKGSTLAFCHANSIDLVVTLFASVRLGTTFCPITPLLPAADIAQRLTDTGIEFFWHQDKNTAQAITSYLENAQIKQVKLSHISLEHFSATSKTALLNEIKLNGEQAASIVYTSGSTGSPKAAVHSLNNHYYSALGSQNVVPLSSNDCWLASLPMNHIGGLAIIFRCFFAGASVALVDKKKLVNSLQNFPITHASLVPTQLYRLVSTLKKVPESKKLQLTHVLIGGAPADKQLLAQACALGLNTFYSYGLTEMCSQVATTHASNDYFNKPLLYRDWQLVDNEIVVRGQTLFLGYMSQGKIKPAIQNGWFYTKDLAEKNEHGVKVIGRKDNMFIVGGENYQPEMIEKVIHSSPLVANIIIVPVPNAEFGQLAVAIVKWAESVQHKYALEKLKIELSQTLSAFEIPKYFIEWQAGLEDGLKPNRKRLQQYAIAALK